MPGDDLQDWTPPRGKGFKTIAWLLIFLIIVGVVGGLVMVMLT